MSYIGDLNKQWSVYNPPINRKDKPTERPMAAAEAGTGEEPEVLEAVEVGRKATYAVSVHNFISFILFCCFEQLTLLTQHCNGFNFKGLAWNSSCMLRREEFGSVIYHDISRLGMMSTFISL